ncbi:MAG: ferrous iron transport protein A [Anaerolineae bacterium]|nr:ferrous iron transport protein A [Anaerolineae bacterium]
MNLRRRVHEHIHRVPPHSIGGIVSLARVPPGQTVNLVHIHGGHRLRKRLADLGLNVGMPVRVIQNPGFGPMILGVKCDSRLALGRGMAEKIQVEHPQI